MLKTIAFAAFALASTSPAYAATLTAYDAVNGNSIAAGIVAAGITAYDLSRGAGVTETGKDNHFRSRNWTVGGDLSDAIANNDYLEWGFTSISTYELETLSLRYDRNQNGPKSMAIFASYDGGAFAQIFSDTDVSDPITTVDIDLNDVEVGDVTFRLFGWDATQSNGRFLIRNNGVGEGSNYGISLTGAAVAPVPLPATLPLLVGALGVFGLVRRKI